MGVILDDSTISFVWSADRPSATLRSSDQEVAPLPATQRERVGTSALYTRVDDVWWRTQFRAGTWDVLLLSQEPSPGPPRPVAAVIWSASDPAVSLKLWPAWGDFESDGLERLYALLLHIPAEVPVRLLDHCGVLLRADQAGTQSVSLLLRQIAFARAAIDARRPAGGGRPWHVVDITPRLDGDHPLSVAVRVAGATGALSGVSVSFTRQPHLACWAVTDAAGMASCQLHDEHGHDHPHDAGSSLPSTVVRFAGRFAEHEVHVPLHAVFATPAPTRCLSDAVASEVAATWAADCRGFARKAWTWPAPGPR